MNDPEEFGMSEVLEAHEIAPRRKWKKRVGLGATAVLLVAGIGAGAAAARWYLHTGPQPAEALPKTTVGYLALDLDPSGKQKLAAKSVLDKLPISDSENLGSVGDFRKLLADAVLRAGDCTSVDFDRDVSPWLGDRAAAALVPLEQGPQPAIVLQSTDDAVADAGMKALSRCGGADFGGWRVKDGWIVLAPTQDVADAVVRADQNGTLADSGAFRDAVDAVDGPGLVTGYVSMKALLPLIPQLAPADRQVPPALVDKVFKAIPSVALAVRAEGDTVTLTSAAKVGDTPSASTAVEDLLADVSGSASAAAAFDLSTFAGFPGMPGGEDAMLEAFRAGMASAGGSREPAAFERSVVRLLGVPLDKVVEDVVHSSAVVAVGATGDRLPTGPDDLPVAAELVPDAAARDRVLGYFHRLDQRFHISDVVSASKDGLVFGFDRATPQRVLHGGGLTRSARFRSVVDLDGHDATSVLYVDLQSGLVRAALREGLRGEDARLLDNLSKLDAVGITGWAQDGYARSEMRIALR